MFFENSEELDKNEENIKDNCKSKHNLTYDKFDGDNGNHITAKATTDTDGNTNIINIDDLLFWKFQRICSKNEENINSNLTECELMDEFDRDNENNTNADAEVPKLQKPRQSLKQCHQSGSIERYYNNRYQKCQRKWYHNSKKKKKQLIAVCKGGHYYGRWTKEESLFSSLFDIASFTLVFFAIDKYYVGYNDGKLMQEFNKMDANTKINDPQHSTKDK